MRSGTTLLFLPEADAGLPAEPQVELSAELLVRAYAAGLFPMADSASGEVGWYSPEPRGILPLDGFRAPRSLVRKGARRPFELRTDTKFEAVMRACAESRPGRERTWISEDLVRAYVELHRHGLAHSVEAWLGERLIGGLYGVHLGAAFFGESMFSRPEQGGTDASKLCLLRLAELLRERGFRLHDVQYLTPHLERFGAIEISRARYLRLLRAALTTGATWPPPGPLGESDRP
jgi:leucyl/phenylalanyl-tRNA--protein transferase